MRKVLAVHRKSRLFRRLFPRAKVVVLKMRRDSWADLAGKPYRESRKDWRDHATVGYLLRQLASGLESLAEPIRMGVAIHNE